MEDCWVMTEPGPKLLRAARAVHRRPDLSMKTIRSVGAGDTCQPFGVHASPGSDGTARQYLYLWTAAADKTQPDFLAVLDVTEADERYGRLVTTLPVPGRGNGNHHTEHEMPADGLLFANGFESGQTFVFDLREPEEPRIAAQFGDVEGYSPPALFHPLAERQRTGDIPDATRARRRDAHRWPRRNDARPRPCARVRRAPGANPAQRFYSAGRSVTRPDRDDDDRHARGLAGLAQHPGLAASDLAAAHLPAAGRPAGQRGPLTAEPRLLKDGKTVLVSTFRCGLYLLEGLDGDAPSGRLVASFPRRKATFCAIPVIAGDYYLVTVPAWNAVVSLDISDPRRSTRSQPCHLEPDDIPHWIAISPDQRRVVVTGYEGMQHQVFIARFDPASGQLALDERFREEGAAEPGFRMDDKTWPHGGDAKGIPHGAVFSRP